MELSDEEYRDVKLLVYSMVMFMIIIFVSVKYIFKDEEENLKRDHTIWIRCKLLIGCYTIEISEQNPLIQACTLGMHSCHMCHIS